MAYVKGSSEHRQQNAGAAGSLPLRCSRTSTLQATPAVNHKARIRLPTCASSGYHQPPTTSELPVDINNQNLDLATLQPLLFLVS